jgi:phosphate transport system substrate-binding protein
VKSFEKVCLALAAVFLVAAGCDSNAGNRVEIDGSSTVFPITEAVAGEFQKEHDARVTIGVSGTGGGFKKFCRGETAINNASRPIMPSELERCEKNGIEFIELPVAYDGISVVVHEENDWVDAMTVEDLKTIWEPEAQGKITKWSQVRDEWPDNELELYGAGVASGTYDYFSKAIVGEEGASRGDFTSSEDDNVLVKGVSSDKNSLGFFGFAYYRQNKDKLDAVPIKAEGASEAVAPSTETIANGTYQPLTRPLFIYVKADAAKNKAVSEFVNYYLTESAPLVEDVGYVAPPESAYKKVRKRFDDRVTGSMFGGEGSQIGVSIDDLLEKSMSRGNQ